MRHVRAYLTVVLCAVAAITGFASSPAVEDAAAGPTGCWGGGPWYDHDDWGVFTFGGASYSGPTKFCRAYRSGPLATSVVPCPGFDLTGWCWTNAPVRPAESGYLYAGDSWFICQRRAPLENPPVGSARNNWWLATIADEAYEGRSGFGYFPATYVSGGGNYQPIPGLAQCPHDLKPTAPPSKPPPQPVEPPGGKIGEGLDGTTPRRRDGYPVEALARVGTRLTPKTGVQFKARLAKRTEVAVRISRKTSPAARAAGGRVVHTRGKRGWNRIRLSSWRHRQLRPGRYTVQVTAHAQGRRSHPLTLSLRIH